MVTVTVAAISLAGCSSGSSSSSSPSATPSPTYASVTSAGATYKTGMPDQQPEVLTSSNGVLNVTLEAALKPVEISGTMITAMTYNGKFTSPTLQVNPGDTINLKLVNNLPESTDLHFHGMHVSPKGNADNIFVDVQPNTIFDYKITIPADYKPGIAWYHPHWADNEGQVASGLGGAIIVTGLKKLLPTDLQNITEKTLQLKDLQVADGAIINKNIDTNAPTTRTVNGLVNPTLTIKPGETQLWNIGNFDAGIYYQVQLTGQKFYVIGEDGDPVNKVWSADTLTLPSGKRYSVLVTGPPAGTTTLQTLPFTTGPEGDQYPQVTEATLVSSGDVQTAATMPVALAPSPNGQPFFQDLSTAPVAVKRTVTLSQNSESTKFYINGVMFDGNYMYTPQLNTVEEWTVVNKTGELHPFHMHVNPFQVMTINGQPFNANSYMDTMSVPGKGTMVFRIKYTDFDGPTVFHCHILAHEEAGMMSAFYILPPVGAPQPPASELKKVPAPVMGMSPSGSGSPSTGTMSPSMGAP